MAENKNASWKLAVRHSGHNVNQMRVYKKITFLQRENEDLGGSGFYWTSLNIESCELLKKAAAGLPHTKSLRSEGEASRFETTGGYDLSRLSQGRRQLREFTT